MTLVARSPRWLLLVPLGAGFAVAVWLAGGGSGSGPRNLLLVSIDTLRADRVGSYGHTAAQTPRLDGLARRGLRFATAATVVPLTLPAHSSLFTGTFPAHHGVRDNGGFYLGDDQDTLAEVLAGAGFRTGGFVAAFVLDGRWGIAQGFERYFDDFDLDRYDQAPGMDAIQRPAGEVIDQALAWLGEEKERPFFAWVHLYDPHTPYEAPEPWRSRFPRTADGAYDAEIAYTDAQLGRLLDALSADGRLDETLVVVTGDHGEMLGEHGEQTHGFFIYDPVVRIPLLMAGAGLPARVIPDQVRIVDVMPTVLELLGVAAPGAVQGVSLLPLAEGRSLDLVAQAESWYPRYHYGWSELTSIQDGRFKLIRAPRRELYDLEQDPQELRNLAEREPARADAMEAALDALLARVESDAAAAGPASIDPETEERLQALGYIGSSPSRRHLEERPRGDPKDKIGLYMSLKRAGSQASAGDYDTAIATVRAALAEDPEIVEAWMLLGNFLSKAERVEEALIAYRDALRLDPEHDGALYSLAIAYKELGRMADARAGFERARELDPRNGKVLWQLADVSMRERRFEEAVATLEQALRLDLDAARFRVKLGECFMELERWDDAERVLQAAVAERPDFEGAHFNLGLVYEERGDARRALQAYDAELRDNPKAYRAAFNSAKLLQAGGRLPEAVARFRQVVELAPEFGTGHLYLAKALLDSGDLEGAVEHARSGLERRPEPKIAPLGHYVLADVYNRQGRIAAAEREVAAARRLQAAGGG
jgi:arylsulfatase A-like enzyme/predicted Zn-dependent protease